MGVAGGPNIIDDGLVLALDAADVFLPVNKNLLTYTNDLSNAAWAKVRCQITASATTAPDGTNTAFAMNITDATGLVRLSQSPISSSIAGGPYTFSVYVKQNTSTAQLLDLGIYNISTTAGTEPSYNILNNFTITGSGGSSISRSVTSVGNGWYRVATTATISNNSVWYLFFDIEAGTGTKVNGQGIYLWGPQFEYGTVATEYQPVNITTRVLPNLVNQSNNALLINNPTYNSTNGGSIVFDGVNDYITGSLQILNAPFTIEYFGKFNNTTQVNYEYFGQVGNATGANTCLSISKVGSQFGSYVGNMYVYGGASNGTFTDISLATTDWVHVVAIATTTSPYVIVYKNAVQGNILTGIPNTDQITAPITTSANYRLGFFQNGTWWLNGSIAIHRIYNRALNASEILQNYNALKSRFNI